MKRLLPIFLAVILLAVAVLPAAPVQAAAVPYGIPTFSITSVNPDQSVTIRAYNFPARDSFNVLMDEIGRQGKRGVKVGVLNSGDGGSFTATFDIPAELYGLAQIAIRLESPYSGYYAFNWFYNRPGSKYGTGGPYVDAPIGYYGIPTFSIESVSPDSEVTIRGYNFPANDRFRVLMGYMGSAGIGGIRVATIETGKGGSFVQSFAIPAELYGQYQIAMRMESPTSGYFAFNWFYNSGKGFGTGGPYVEPTDTWVGSRWGYAPTYSIQHVKRNKTVTVQLVDMPANAKLDVSLGVYGAYGQGYHVGVIDTGSGGRESYKFEIPAALKGEQIISIRIVNRASGYYIYNWFYNSNF
jgi:hypothetical protein